MKLEYIEINNPKGLNFILGMAHFIKTIEDLHEAIIQTNPGMKFGAAFCEASGPRLIRVSGNDETLKDIAVSNSAIIGAGHSFLIFIDSGFPVNILNTIKMIPEVCRIFCATANPTTVVVASNDHEQRGILGVLDGFQPLGIETETDAQERMLFLRKIGYKLG
ncbi:adenosine-specific kinase [bacterium]|nr:adenosine-specific kinase [candidate division CSSED10-310 bacterium]